MTEARAEAHDSGRQTARPPRALIPPAEDETGLSKWLFLAIALVLFQFALPFVVLLSRDLKRNARRLAGVALIVLVSRLLDLFWLLKPAFSPARFSIHWMDAAAVLGVGGLWLSFFLWRLRGQPLLPLRDPALPFAVEAST